MTDRVAIALPIGFHNPKRPPTRRTMWLGLLVLTAFVGGFLAWAPLAPLQSAAIAGGAIGLDTNRSYTGPLNTKVGEIRRILFV